MHKNLKNKKILVTAGPTWSPIDEVRVISNVSSGLTGLTIARHAAKLGATVTLLLGPVGSVLSSQFSVLGLRVKRFRYFGELKKLVKTELTREKYDILVHAAAVSDYRPLRARTGKIRSGNKKLIIELRPTVKIADLMRRQAKGAFLVMFKLEARRPKKGLADTAYNSMRRAGADMVVANNIEEVGPKRHRAYIIDRDKKLIAVKTKKELAMKLFEAIAEKID